MSKAHQGGVEESRRLRAEGALLGLAVGDALGTTLEFTKPAPVPFATRVGPHREVTGGGPFRVAPGQVTDDTAMAVCLADSLRAKSGFDAEDVARRYAAWSKVTFDIGAQTRDALTRVKALADPRQAGVQGWIAGGRKAAGNGSLMRTAPIGVYFSKDDDARRRATVEDSLITHADPRCVLACAAFNGAIAACIQGGGVTPAEMLTAAAEELAPAAALLAEFLDDAPAISQGVEAVRADLEAARHLDPELYGDALDMLRTQGFVRVAFRLAFWELVHAESFEEALVNVVNRGGDADTNGAITGALLGRAHRFDVLIEKDGATLHDVTRDLGASLDRHEGEG